ncbi:hypothetical protein COCOBI_02-8700 [Coccomyxa sp. Obi]|nr:hypothetical protein COCOBI_02-8700 [Coccomyxa sp. Obi]
MRPHRSEYKQLPVTSNVPPACSYGHGFNLRRPLLLLTQLSMCRGTMSLQSLAESSACGNSKLPRGRSRQARRLWIAHAECGCRHTRSRARSGNRRAATATAMPQGSSERGSNTSKGDVTLPEGWEWKPGDCVTPTPQQELLLMQLLASTTASELDKKKIFLVGRCLGVDVEPVLEQAGLTLDWLVGMEYPKEFIDPIKYSPNPVDAFWDGLNSLYEEEVKGRRKFLEQPVGESRKKGFGASSGGGGGGGRGRKTKPRKVKSGYEIINEVKTKEQNRQLERNVAQWAAEDAALSRLMEEWTQDEKDAYLLAVCFWDLSWEILLMGVGEFFKASRSGRSSLTTCMELLTRVRGRLWRSINLGHERVASVGGGNAGGPSGVKDALQGLVARKLLDLMETAASLRVNFGNPVVSGLEDATLNQIVEATEGKPYLMPPPPASAFLPSANGGLSIVEEILARQVMGSVDAWQKVSVLDRMERLVAPGWKDFRPQVERSLMRLSAEDARMATHMLGHNFTRLEESLLPALLLSATEASSGSDDSTAAESEEDRQVPPQATAADRRFAMLEAPPIDAPAMWQQTTPEPADQQAEAGSLPTDSSLEPTDSSSQAGTLSHAEPDGARTAAEEPAASSSGAMDFIASPEVAWSGVDSWAAAAASVGGVPFAAPDQAFPAAVAGKLIGVRQQSTAAELALTAEAAADASADTSQSSSGVEVGTTAEAAGAIISADNSLSSSGVEQQNAENSSASTMAAADLSLDSSRSNRNDELQSRTDDVEADAVASADKTSNGSLPNSGAEMSRTADSAQADGAAAAEQAAAAPADSVRLDSSGEQRLRTDSTETDAVNVAGGVSSNGSLSRSSRRRRLRSADGPETHAAAAASTNGARSSSGRWSTADGVEEPIDRREDVSSSSQTRGRMTGREEGRASVAPEAPASSAASSTSAARWSQLAIRPVLPAEQRPQQDVGSESSSSGKQSRRSGKKEPAPFGGSILADGTYLAKQLLPHQQKHWKAAGILLYSRGQDGSLQLLLGRIDFGARPAGRAKVYRRHEGWWILGGSRDATDFCAEATAVREMTEETAGILSGYSVCVDEFGHVLWYPPGKYAVFLYELRGQPDIPGHYARLRAMRGRVKGRRRQVIYKAAGQPRPMSQLAWVPLRDLINGRLRMHWILEDMLRRTPLLPYLLQIERLTAESAPPTGRPLQLGPPSLGSTDEPDRYPRSAKSGKGSPQRRSGARADRTSTQQNGATTSWTAPDGEERSMAGARSGASSAAAVVPSDTATVLGWDITYNNGATATAAAAAVMAGARSGSDAAAAAAPEAAGPARPRAAEGEATFAAVAEAAREFLKTRGVEVEAEEEKTQRETEEKDTGRALVRPVAQTLKRRRQRLKRAKLAGAL